MILPLIWISSRRLNARSSTVKDAAVAGAGSGPMHLKSLAESDSLVYTALPPRRIMDTRVATGPSGVQGPIAGGVLYHVPGFLPAASTYQQYGGASSDCGLSAAPAGPGSNIKAIAVTITILNPNFDAFLGVSDNSNLSSVLSNVALDYTHGQGLSTVYTVPQGLGNTVYFALPTGLSAQLIFDVIGYYKVGVSRASAWAAAGSPSRRGPRRGETFLVPPVSWRYPVGPRRDQRPRGHYRGRRCQRLGCRT